jgi:hypothetical protein
MAEALKSVILKTSKPIIANINAKPVMILQNSAVIVEQVVGMVNGGNQCNDERK